MAIQKWQLISKKDVSPHKWFPIEMRTYKLPNGRVVEDFSVTTIGDVSMVVPITNDKKVVLVNQYKPGVDEILLEFPAGRIDSHHESFIQLAQHELQEEAGINVSEDQLSHFATISGFTTKGTEKVYLYFVANVEFNAEQSFDENEDIEVVTLNFAEIEEYIYSGKIWSGQTIAAWELAKKHFPEELK